MAKTVLWIRFGATLNDDARLPDRAPFTVRQSDLDGGDAVVVGGRRQRVAVIRQRDARTVVVEATGRQVRRRRQQVVVKHVRSASQGVTPGGATRGVDATHSGD